MQPQTPTLLQTHAQAGKVMRTLPLLISSIICSIACLVALPAFSMVFFNDVGDKGIYYLDIILGVFAVLSFIVQIITVCITCWRFMRVSRLAKSVVALHLSAVSAMIIIPIVYAGVVMFGLTAASLSTAGGDAPGFITIILSFIFSLLFSIVPMLFAFIPIVILSALTCAFILVAKPPMLTTQREPLAS